MTVETCVPSLARRIEADNEAASSPGPYGPPSEIRGFCWCSINPASTACVEQALIFDARNASRGRQPHTHRVRDSGGGNGGDGDDGGGSDSAPFYHPLLAGYDRALEHRLAKCIIETIGEEASLDAHLPEITSALVATLGYALSREPGSLDRSLPAVHSLLITNISSALRISARNREAQ